MELWVDRLHKLLYFLLHFLYAFAKFDIQEEEQNHEKHRLIDFHNLCKYFFLLFKYIIYNNFFFLYYINKIKYKI